MALIDSLIVLIVGILVGALGIYVGAQVVTGQGDYMYAIITAVIASFIWTLVSFFIGWIPFLGPLLALIAYIGVINFRYPGGWINAIAIGAIAWLASLLVLYLLVVFNIATFDAIGVPGV